MSTTFRQAICFGLGVTFVVSAVFACGSQDDPATNVDAGTDTPLPPPATSSDDAAADAQEDVDAGAPADIDPYPDAGPLALACAKHPCPIQLAGAAAGHACVLFDEGSVHCWGTNASGQLGTASLTAHGPTKVAGLGAVVELHVATDAQDPRSTLDPDGDLRLGAVGTSCARRNDGTILCFGANNSGQLGHDADGGVTDTDPHPVPSLVKRMPAVAHFAFSDGAACGLTDEGTTSCWGDPFGLDGYKGVFPVPALGDPLATDGHPLTAISLWYWSGFGLLADGRLMSWGVISEVGRLASAGYEPPELVPRLDQVSSIWQNCAIRHGAAYCAEDRFTNPLFVPVDGAPIVQIDGVYGITGAGVVVAIGKNVYGQLGTGDTAAHGGYFDYEKNVSVPYEVVKVAGLGGLAVQVADLGNAGCALLVDGSVACWGDNRLGQLGKGTTDEAPHPLPSRVTF